jgi:hypothetical protein
MFWQIPREDPHGVFVAGVAVEQEQESGRLRCRFPNPQGPVVELNEGCVTWVWHG